MSPGDKPMFNRVLATTFDVYQKNIPMPDTQTLWWKLLEAYSLQEVSRAMSSFVATDSKFPPTPGQILEILRADMPQHLGADEAWAIALGSRDEDETIVWTPEIAQAMGAAQPVLDMGDEVGARMAFKEAYARLVARSKGEPIKWQVSMGRNPERRRVALEQAKNAGLLTHERVTMLLPPPDTAVPTEDHKAREQLAVIKAMLAAGAKRPEYQLPDDVTRTRALKEQAEQRAREYERGKK